MSYHTTTNSLNTGANNYTTSSSFNFDLLSSLTEYGYIQDRLPGDDLILPHTYDDIKIKPNDHVTSQVINYSLEKIHKNWLYLISSSVIPSNSIPNTDYATRMIVDNSTTLMVERGIEQPGEYAPRPKWLSTFNDVDQFKTTAAQGDQWRNRIWEGVKDISKIRNTANPENYNFVANTSTNLILLSGTNTGTGDNALGNIDVIGNFNDVNNPIYSNSDVTHPSNEVLFRDIKNHVITDERELYVLDGFHRTIFKFDINGMLSLDTAILLNDTPGRLMTGMIGGPGTISDKTRFTQPIVMETVNNLLYVIDYSESGSAIKTFDSDLNWKGTFDLGATLSSGPIDLKYNDETRRFYVMCHKRTFFGGGDGSPLTTAEQIEPAQIVVFDSSFNYIETRDLNDTSYSANINVESYKRIYFSIENKNIMYVLTNKGVYKKYVNRPERFIGEFLLNDKNVGGGDRSQNFQDMTIFESAITEGTNILQKDEILLLDGFYQVIFEFFEDSNYERSIQTEFDEKVLYFNDLQVYDKEYVSTLTYNKVFTKHIYNNSLLIENTYRKFTTKFNPSGIPQYIGFRYLNETQLDQTKYDITLDHYIGTNELVTTNTFNRCMEQLLEIQNNVKDKMQEKSINVFPLITQPVLLVSPFADAAVAIGVDTDFDGIPDSADTDDDNDGLADITELANNLSDPLLVDTDEDGLTDFEEVQLGTQPRQKDSDGDTADDGFDTFPLNPAASVDSDGDGMPDTIDPNRDNINPVLVEDDDDDNDGFLDAEDQAPTDPNRLGGDATDQDNDGVDDGIITDADQDGVIDLRDQDNDGSADSGDTVRGLDNDIDGDGILNDTATSTVPDDQPKDLFPTDPNKVDGIDQDGDGVDDYFDDDRDGDGLTNQQEIQGIEVTDVYGIKRTYTSDPDDSDTDDDGISDFKEYGPGGRGTNPQDEDTDGDGVHDFVDDFPQDAIADVDTDEDGKPDELREGENRDPVFGSPPLEEDTDDDNDGLSDELEDVYNSDSLVSDTDGDGLTDGDEVFTYSTNPTAIDTDLDGITDSQEITGYTPGRSWFTDPTKQDTDGDGIDDKTEQEGTYSDEGYITDPTESDTDGDSLDDKAEQDGVTSDMSGETHQIDPTKSDTDGDGITDDKELGFDTVLFNNLAPAVATITDNPEPGSGFGSSVVTNIRVSINDTHFEPTSLIALAGTGTGTNGDPYMIYVANNSQWSNFAGSLRSKLAEQSVKDQTLVDPGTDLGANNTVIVTAIQLGGIGNDYTVNVTGSNSSKVIVTQFAGGVDDTSNPNSADTDGDQLGDLQEIIEHNTVLRDPDTDADGVMDGVEVQQDIDPLDPDTDDDTLTDGQEVNGVQASDGVTYTTNPKLVDSDGDTISDADELNLSGDLRSDPNDQDTDDDNLRDDFDQTPLVAGLQLKPVDEWPTNFVAATAPNSDHDILYEHPSVVVENESSAQMLGGMIDSQFIQDSIGSLFENPEKIASSSIDNTTHFSYNTTTRVVEIKSNQDFEEDGYMDNPYREAIVTVVGPGTDVSVNNYKIKYRVLITDELLQLKNTLGAVNPIASVSIDTALSAVAITTEPFTETPHNTTGNDTNLLNLESLFINPIEIESFNLTSHTSSILTHGSNTPIDSFTLNGSMLVIRPQDFESQNLIEDAGKKYAACTIEVTNKGQDVSTFTITVSARITNTDLEDTDQDNIQDQTDATKTEAQLQFSATAPAIPSGYIAASVTGAADHKTITTSNITENNLRKNIIVLDDLFDNPDFFDTTTADNHGAAGNTTPLFYKVGQANLEAGDENYKIRKLNSKWVLQLEPDRDFENLLNATGNQLSLSFMVRGQQSNRSLDKMVTVVTTIVDELLVFKTPAPTGLVINSQDPTKAIYTHNVTINENANTTDIIDITTLLDNLEEYDNVSVSLNSTGSRYTLVGNMLKLLSVDHELQVDQTTDFISCELTITDKSKLANVNRVLKLDVNVTIADIGDEDLDDLKEADDATIGADPADLTETTAGLQFNAASRTKISSNTPLITVTKVEEQTHDQLATVDQMKAFFDNPTYLRTSNPFTVTDNRFEFSGQNLNLKTAQDFETMASNPIILTITAHDRDGGTRTFDLSLTITDAEATLNSGDSRLSISGDTATFTPATDWSGFNATKASTDTSDNAVLSNPSNAVTVVTNMEQLFNAPKELQNNPYSLTGSDATDFELVGTGTSASLKLKANTTITTSLGNGVVNKTFTLTAKRRGSGKADMTIDFSIPMTALTFKSGTTLAGSHGVVTGATTDENTTTQTVTLNTLKGMLVNPLLLKASGAFSVDDTTNFEADTAGINLKQSQNFETTPTLDVIITAVDINSLNSITFKQTVTITDVTDEDADGILEDPNDTKRDDPTLVGDGFDDTPDTAGMQFKSTGVTSGVTTGNILPNIGIQPNVVSGVVKSIKFTTNNVNENNVKTLIAVLDNNLFDNPQKLHATKPFYHNTSSPATFYADTNYQIEKDSDGKWKLYLKVSRDYEQNVSNPTLTSRIYVMYDNNVSHSNNNLYIDVETTLVDLPDTPITWDNTGGNINTTVEVEEGTTAVGTIAATGDDADTIVYAKNGSGGNNNLFTVTSNGTITFNSAPEFNQHPEEGSGTNNTYTLNVLAKYSSTTTHQITKTITVTVADVQDLPITFKIDGNTPTSGSGTFSNPYVYSKSVDENTNSFATINVEGDTEGDINMELNGSFLVSGHGSNQIASHTLTQATGAYQATITKTTGGNYDAESSIGDKFYLVVKASYSNVSPTHDVYLAIKMTVNDLPDTILQWNNTSNITANVDENTALSVDLSNYGPTGAADDAATVQYVITQDTGNDFTINGNTLSWNNGSTGKDHEAGATRTCKIRMRYATGDTSNAYQSSEKTVNITLNDLADTNITWTSNTATTNVDENAALNYNLSSLINSFDDAAGTKQNLVYQITGGNQSSDFTISGHTLSWNNGSTGKNYETRTSYQVKLRARYAAGQTANQSPELTVTVNLNDVADVAPTITGSITTSYTEGEDKVLGTLSATPDITNAQITWSSSNTSVATINSSGQVRTVTSATAGTYNNVTFTATESGNSNTGTKSFNITITAA